jgi:hypothetical protein
MTERNHTGRTVMVVGGIGLLAWLLLRGKGFGFGGSDGSGSGDSVGTGASSPPQPGDSPRPTHCTIWVRANGISVDGVPSELDNVVARCRGAASVKLHVTGAANQGVFDRVRLALNDAQINFVVVDGSSSWQQR